jgi:hypothetical protein
MEIPPPIGSYPVSGYDLVSALEAEQEKSRTNGNLVSKRKAIRAALLSGVKPMQVAKHFGVPLATVCQISTGHRQPISPH